MSAEVRRQISFPRRTFIKGALAAGLVAGPSGLLMPKAYGQSEPTSGGTLRVAQETNISSLDPHYSIFGDDRHILYQIYDTVTQFDEQLVPQPALAESWETPDPLNYTFHLRQGVKFHDGTNWNAEAFKYNVERVINAGGNSPVSVDFAPIESVDIVNDYTVSITLKEPIVALLAMFADRWGMMVSPTAAEELGDQFAGNPVGAGPFRFVEYIPDDRMVVERFPEYWDGPFPYLDGVTWSIIPDGTVRYTNLRAQQLDVMPLVAPQDIDEIKSSGQFGYLEIVSLGFEDVRFNCSKPPFDNMALRQACSLGIDRQAIVDNVFQGHAEVANGPLPPTMWAANENLPFAKRDVEGAKAKLVEAGYPDGIDVQWDCPTAGDEGRRAEAMQAQLAEIGINVEILFMENVQAKQREVDGENQAEVLSWSGRADPDLTMYSMFHDGGGYNTMRYVNPRVDELTEQARLTSDQQERKALYDEAQLIVVEEAPRLFVVHKLEVVAFQPNVQGIDYFPDTRTRYKHAWLAQQ